MRRMGKTAALLPAWPKTTCDWILRTFCMMVFSEVQDSGQGPRTKTACRFGMPDIIVPWFLPRPEEPARKRWAGELPQAEFAWREDWHEDWHEDCYAIPFSCTGCERKPIRRRFPSDCKAILTVPHVN